VNTFLKWAGGKRQILQNILPYITTYLDDDHRYFEPFVGGGIVFLTLGRPNCVINDVNSELMNCYMCIRDHPNDLIASLEIHAARHSKEYYYGIRNLDRDEGLFQNMTRVEKAARVIYLNHTCFNGLYRVNRHGFFNTPIGKFVHPKIADQETIQETSVLLRRITPEILNTSFQEAVRDAREGDFIYFDPPYDYENNNGYTRYSPQGFNHINLQELKNTSDRLIDAGCHVLISNNATNRVLELFTPNNDDIEHLREYDLEIIEVQRYIGAKKESRIIVKEVLIHGYRRNVVPAG